MQLKSQKQLDELKVGRGWSSVSQRTAAGCVTVKSGDKRKNCKSRTYSRTKPLTIKKRAIKSILYAMVGVRDPFEARD